MATKIRSDAPRIPVSQASKEIGASEKPRAAKPVGERPDGKGYIGKYGVTYNKKTDTFRFRIYSGNATRVQLELFSGAIGEAPKLVVNPDTASFKKKPMGEGLKGFFDSTPAMVKKGGGTWEVEIPGSVLKEHGLTLPTEGKANAQGELDVGEDAAMFYGYRFWGPNWTYDPKWTPGSQLGFNADVDKQGNRFDPNKLIIDPRAQQHSHEGVHAANPDDGVYATGPANRNRDSGPVGPKGVIPDPKGKGFGPSARRTRDEAANARPLIDSVIREEHVRQATKIHPGVPPELQGTYAGLMHPEYIAYLKKLGITTLELLPIQQFDHNEGKLRPDNTTEGKNNWGYNTQGFFAPNLDYSSDKSPGGPVREFKEMVKTLRANGIEIALDVVYNHTSEGGASPDGQSSQSRHLRGADNASYYKTEEDAYGNRAYYQDRSGVGAELNPLSKPAVDFVVDSIKYFTQELGVNHYRFDLAPVLGDVASTGYAFNKLARENALNRLVTEVPQARLIAEPWGVGEGTYQVGNFPKGWAEWNGQFRDNLRDLMNSYQGGGVTMGTLASLVAGSRHLYGDDGRMADASVNMITAHDGFTLNDLVSNNTKNNNQPFPFGASDGGEDHNRSNAFGGDRPTQKQVARGLMALNILSQGVPMIVAGDEYLRTQGGNNNAWNVISDAMAIKWELNDDNQAFFNFTQQLIQFRKQHPALRQAAYRNGQDRNNDGVKDLSWYTPSGFEADGGYMDNVSNRYLGWRIDGTEVPGETAKSIFIGYNSSHEGQKIQLPTPRPGNQWYRIADTARHMEGPESNFSKPGNELVIGREYYLNHRTVGLFVEAPIGQPPQPMPEVVADVVAKARK